MAFTVLDLALVLLAINQGIHCRGVTEIASDIFTFQRDLAIDNRNLLKVTAASSLLGCSAKCGAHVYCLTAVFKPETDTTGLCALHSTRKLNVETYLESSSVLLYKESIDALAAFSWECVGGYIPKHNIFEKTTDLDGCKEFCLQSRMCLSFDYDPVYDRCMTSNVTREMFNPSIFVSQTGRSVHCVFNY
ncbi:hypothetical protein CAPTEDRAFT_212963 [Capitella teleta]|uniref:Apple domain-containing protein n=1 Tax=Capitella teleta TaxID=283909 RepID=R7UHQ9_CAPTE|nr:hypothetical protein CAPTEDRAFT_212963 [Capitella teleta]|eukprot:ELU02817.1 hypothetical protein CAPTEDRAFT_212963 [Capitella teleta]